jgi:integrase
MAGGGELMSQTQFQSLLALKLESFVRLKQATGRDYEDQAWLLGLFDRFLVEEDFDETRITREIVESYQQTFAGLSDGSRSNRFGVMRQFCEYLALDVPESFVPPTGPLNRPSSRHRRVPYIFSEEKIRALLGAAGQLKPADSLRPLTYRTFYGLLYAAGLRTGEAIALNLGDYHPERSAIYIRQGKFRKSRWVPFSPSVCEALGRYLERRTRMQPSNPEAPFFITRHGGRLKHATVYGNFRGLLEQCGIHHRKGRGTRLHDLRHTFAIHRLLQWYRDGQDINQRLPALATYMGHVNICSTQVYLQATPELIEQVDQRFHHHFITHVQKKGQTS